MLPNQNSRAVAEGAIGLFECVAPRNNASARRSEGGNQCDVHRGSDFVYRNDNDGRVIDVYMKKSRSGKTVAWEFHCHFAGAIEF